MKTSFPLHTRTHHPLVRWLMVFFVVFGLSLSAKAQASGGPPVYQGLTNSSLGGATLTVSGNQLIVGNLGSSGQDGVAIAMPTNLTGLTVNWQPLDVSNTLPVGAYVQSQAVGTANGINNGVLGTLTESKMGTGNYAISADYSPLGASTYTVQVYNQGVLMAQATNQSGASFATVNVMGRGKDVGDIITPLSDETGEGPPGVLTLAGGTTSVPYDRLVVTPDNVTSAVVPTAFQITASGVPAITITSENVSLVYQGLTNTSLGGAAIAVSDQAKPRDTKKLALADLGTNGQDGVSIALPGDLTALDVGWEDLDASNTLPVGAYIQSQMVGTANGITNGVLGTLTETKAGTSNYVISADFSPVGASTYTVQAYNQGVLVAEATNQNGASLAVAQNAADTADIIHETPNGSESWDSSVAISVMVGGQLVTCDRLEVSPENASLPSAPTAFQIVASQIPAITITSENESLVYQGVTSTSLGNAALAVAGNQLVVSNLGTNGQGGIQFGIQDSKNLADGAAKSQRVEGVFQPLDNSNTVPVGGYLQSLIVGTANDITNGILGTLTQTKAGNNNYEISADFTPMGASTCTVQAYDQGVLVGQAANQSATSMIEEPAFSTGLDLEISSNSIGLTEDFASGTSIVLGGQAVTCDQLEFIPDNVPLPSGVTGFQILASQVPSLTFTRLNVTVLYAGFDVTSLGNAALAVAGNQLVVSNLGTNGQGGIQFGIQDSKNIADGAAKSQPVEGVFQPLDNSNTVPVGGYLQSLIVGTANDITNGILGTLTQTKAGNNNYEISADFTPMGASTCTVQAYDQGVLVGQAANQSATSIIEEPAFSTGLDLEISSNSIGLTEDFASGTSIVLGGQAVTCDQLEFIPDNVPLPSGVTGFQILASQVPSLTLTSVAVSPLLLNLSQNGQDLLLQWYGTAGLQESTNLATWTDDTNATSPYAAAAQNGNTTPASQGPSKFYRLVFRP